ncbi:MULTISPECIES: hypothetical protein [Enterobacter cloacae complex]|uniref:Fimbrial protein n=2 Tax=Enterobacter cloacae complex TaxID=354276 RepID=A0A7H8UKS1_ENTCL|nr:MULTISPECIES: hypothetical protein [Enterobacter cloacae complex]MDE4079281.1 hypothetical protein [Enterobacter pasteurii]QKZ99287.1 hypothetical protein HWQ14_17235 [Enterobacter cloacae]
MKKFFLLIYIVTQYANAATLQCENYKASRMNSPFVSSSVNALTNVEVKTIAVGTPKVKNFHITITYPDANVGLALAGNYVHIYPNIDDKQSAPLIIGERLTGLTGQTISIPCTSPDSNGCAILKHNWAPIVSASPSSATLASIDRNVTVPERLNRMSTELTITSNNVQVPSTTVTGNQSVLFGELTVEDSLTIPDKIDIGSLTAGENKNAGIFIDYTTNTNNLDVRLSPSYDISAPLTVNEKQVYGPTSFKPPFSIGLYVMTSAQPGTKSANVIASWTCP